MSGWIAVDLDGTLAVYDGWVSIDHIGALKDFGMEELWDDRAVQVEANTGRMIGYSRRGLA